MLLNILPVFNKKKICKFQANIHFSHYILHITYFVSSKGKIQHPANPGPRRWEACSHKAWPLSGPTAILIRKIDRQIKPSDFANLLHVTSTKKKLLTCVPLFLSDC